MKVPPLLLTMPFLGSCAFAAASDADAGGADARVRADASPTAIDASPSADAAANSPDAAPADAAGGELLVISEIVDATLSGGLPKFVELTNLGPGSADLSEYSLGVYSNGSSSLNSGASHGLAGSLAAGASFVLSFENSDSSGNGSFFDVYGQNPDDFSFGALINGNDTVVLFRGLATGSGADAVTVDVYGEVGVDGTGQAWEYSNGFATRKQASTTAKAIFDAADWDFSGPDALVGADAAAISAATSPGSH